MDQSGNGIAGMRVRASINGSNADGVSESDGVFTIILGTDCPVANLTYNVFVVNSNQQQISDGRIINYQNCQVAGEFHFDFVQGAPTAACAAAAPTVVPTPVSGGGPTGTPTGIPAVPTSTPCPTSTATPTSTPVPSSSGGGGGGGTSAPASTSNTAPAPSGSSGGVVITTSTTASTSGGVTVVGAAAPGTGVSDLPTNIALPSTFASTAPVAPPVDPSVFTRDTPAAITASVSAATGGIIVAGNAAIIVPPAALAAVPGQQATFAVNPATNVPVPGGPAQFSPNGTLLDIKITDTSGNLVTTFPVPIPIEVKYNGADVGQANGHPETLTAAYVVDAQTPSIANPLSFPVNTFVLFPADHVSLNVGIGTLTVTTQAIGSVVSVVTNPVSYVQTLQPATPELSSFDPNASQSFGDKPQFSYLQVVEPQIGSRLLVLDPDTGNYSYVDAAGVGPSGPPPAAPAAVLRGVRTG